MARKLEWNTDDATPNDAELRWRLEYVKWSFARKWEYMKALRESKKNKIKESSGKRRMEWI